MSWRERNNDSIELLAGCALMAVGVAMLFGYAAAFLLSWVSSL